MFKQKLRKVLKAAIVKMIPELWFINTESSNVSWQEILSSNNESFVSGKARLYPPYQLWKSVVDDYTYISRNSRITMARIGKFCSIGPNFMCGWGKHPTNGISTSPFFYSTQKQNGFAISSEDKFAEREWITIGNDVFIGMNVVVLDGVQIGDGAVVGAGTVVSKDVPPYAIVAGSPMRTIRYRFNPETIQELLRVKWWERGEEHFILVERNFFDIKRYLSLVKETEVTDE